MAMSENSLRSGRRRFLGGELDNDPMSSMGNLMDVMLVFACALMIALVTHYNVQLSATDTATTDATTTGSAAQTETAQRPNDSVDANLMDAGATDTQDVSSYDEIGTLYRDPDTGDLYVIS